MTPCETEPKPVNIDPGPGRHGLRRFSLKTILIHLPIPQKSDPGSKWNSWCIRKITNGSIPVPIPCLVQLCPGKDQGS